MEVKSSSNVVTISGNIKSVGDFQDIKNAVDAVTATYKSIAINVVDSLSITSSVIGYLNKLVQKDKIDIRLYVGNEQLLELLSDLNLVSTFKAQKGLR